jgi:single-stranded-DNA-specific exonuclease
VLPAFVAPQYRWHLRGEASVAARRTGEARHGLHPLAAAVLAQRGIAESEFEAFLRPSLRTLPEPERLPQFTAAAEAFERAAAGGRTILLHGDYDVDGTCGVVLLHFLCELLGARCEVFVPDRNADGYSFGPRSLEAAARCDAGLVIAVDNGTSAHGPLAALAERGIEVVVIDHHPPGATLPRCTALVNPWLAPEEIFPHFCGTATAWLFAWGVLRRRHGTAPGALPAAARTFLNDTLGLAALATVADVMPLTGPNRALVAAGLRALGDSGLPGVRALLGTSRIRGAPTAQDLAFRVAPRLNAAGRLGRAELAFRVLASRSAREAQALATELDALNVERRAVQERELASLEPDIAAQRANGSSVIFAGRHAAHFGVLGVVAGQVLERTGLPTLLWAECAPGLARGSARAPAGCDVVRLLDAAAEHLGGYGGHARAAGFHFDPTAAPRIAAALQRAAAAAATPAAPELTLDGEIGPGETDLEAALALAGLAPYGEGFPEPVFLCADVRLARDPRPLGGDGGHAELLLEREGATIRALAWRMMDRLRPLRAGMLLDAAVTVGVSDFRGRRAVEWTVRDLRAGV